MTLTRKGDIDTDGDPIGWKIVGIGNDGSVLCEKGNGQRRRYSFGDWAKEQLSGEAWERLTKERDEALRELANERASCGQVTTEQINVIAELQAKLERPEMPECVAKLLQTFQPVGQSLINAVQTVRDHYAPPFRIQGRSLSTHSGQVIAERDATIAELQSKLERPEMPECVAKLLDAIHRFGVLVNTSDYVQEVRDYYAPPFRITGPGVYLDSNGREVLIFLRHGKLWYGCDPETRLTTIFEESGKSGCVQLAKYLRQLEG
jgi:hypothetical protein